MPRVMVIPNRFPFYRIQFNLEPTYKHVMAMFCIVTNSFPSSSLAAAAVCCRGEFHVKWDTLHNRLCSSSKGFNILKSRIIPWSWLEVARFMFLLSSSGTFLHEKVNLSRYMPLRHMGGEVVQLLLILNLGTRWGWVVSVTPRPRFTPGERTPRYPLDRRLGRPQSRSGRRG
jgi:hypothetical protein